MVGCEVLIFTIFFVLSIFINIDLLLLFNGLSVFDLLLFLFFAIINFLIFNSDRIFFFSLLFFAHVLLLFRSLITFINFVTVYFFLLIQRLGFLDLILLGFLAFDLFVVGAFTDFRFFIDVNTKLFISLDLILDILFISDFVFAGNDIILFFNRLLHLFVITHDIVLHRFVVIVAFNLRKVSVNYLLGFLTFFLIVLFFFDLLFGLFSFHKLLSLLFLSELL